MVPGMVMCYVVVASYLNLMQKDLRDDSIRHS
jgi:hypothetical protein